MNDIVNDLRHAISHDLDPWDSTLYERAADEIERLRALIAAWVDANDAWVEAGTDDGYRERFIVAHDALRKAVGR